jgi:hypothetical protein
MARRYRYMQKIAVFRSNHIDAAETAAEMAISRIEAGGGEGGRGWKIGSRGPSKYVL